MPDFPSAKTFQKPTQRIYRTLLAMQIEDFSPPYPADGCVLMGGCDKTTPALLMGAISMNLPAIFVPAGPMLRGHWRDQTLGSGTDVWKYWDDRRAGLLDLAAWGEIEDGIARSAGTCMTIATAATLMSLVEALGLTLPGASAIPAVDSNHVRLASASGRRIVEMVWEDVKPTDILTAAALANAIVVDMAIGGATNTIIHPPASAGPPRPPPHPQTLYTRAAGAPRLSHP